MQVYPIDEYGFVIWENHRIESDDYIPQNNEVTISIPQDKVWTQPRWNGKKWVEGKNHPNVPTPQSQDPIMPEMELPKDGVYWLTDGNKTIPEMMQYLFTREITESDVIIDSQHICDVRTIPVLLKMIQDQQNEIQNLKQHLGIKPIYNRSGNITPDAKTKVTSSKGGTP